MWIVLILNAIVQRKEKGDRQGLKPSRKVLRKAADPELSQEEWAQCGWGEGVWNPHRIMWENMSHQKFVCLFVCLIWIQNNELSWSPDCPSALIRMWDFGQVSSYFFPTLVSSGIKWNYYLPYPSSTAISLPHRDAERVKGYHKALGVSLK